MGRTWRSCETTLASNTDRKAAGRAQAENHQREAEYSEAYPDTYSLVCRLQPGLKDRGYGDDSPLAQLFELALDGFGTRGGLERAVIAQNAVRVVSWRTVPARKTP